MATNENTTTPLWFKDAIFYELRVRSFADSNNDGIGDLRGATEKLDYLRDLGVTLLWLLPFFPSPGRDDGYDIADYMNVHPDVGTLEDFQEFLDEAHKRDLKVMVELVLNHTSDQHPWFQRARRAPAGSPERDFYVWSDTTDRYKEARIIFKDFELSNWAWDPVAGAYYWHRFFSHQPDLNYDNPVVQEAVFEIMDFWLDMGVDGLRLDAVPYLYQREGTGCENLPEVHDFLKKLRSHIDDKYEDRVLLAEANQWPEDAVAYFGDGDECHMAFHFPIMPRLFMALHMEERFPIIDILNQTPDIPDNCQWAIFLRNHDELTLEMVTDEERDYMYNAYAQEAQARINLGIRRRLSPLLRNDRKKIELMNALLFSLPGTPVLYYGDEIGMGDNFYLGDRNGVRTPMQWSPDRNAGFSRANPQKLFLPVITDPEYHYETVNVEAQQGNPHSLLWWIKRMIALRKRFMAFGRGSLEILSTRNARTLVFLRRYQDEIILVVCNLSRFVQYLEIDLADLDGYVPVELFGGTRFPAISDDPYFLTLGPHAFYWFQLQSTEAVPSMPKARDTDQLLLAVQGEWTTVFDAPARESLERMLADYARSQRWFQGQTRQITGAYIRDMAPLPTTSGSLMLVEMVYADAGRETYLMPIDYASGQQAGEIAHEMPEAIITHMLCGAATQPERGMLYDPASDPTFYGVLLTALRQNARLNGKFGQVIASVTPALAAQLETHPDGEDYQPALVGIDKNNTSARFNEMLAFKLIRKVVQGVNPELEIGRYLSEYPTPLPVPPLLGSLEYRHRRMDEPFTLGVLHAFVPNQGDAWRHTLDWLGRFLDDILARSGSQELAPPVIPSDDLVTLTMQEIPEDVVEMLGGYLIEADLMGRRTAEVHDALAVATDDPNLAPESFTTLYQRSYYQSLRNLTNRINRRLQEYQTADDELAENLRRVTWLHEDILSRFEVLIGSKLTGQRIRVHGDYHLGQVLYTGNDFVLIDFEGLPARPLVERRIKHSPLRDVAGMLRSFHYAAYAALPGIVGRSVGRMEDLPVLEPWARFWTVWASVAFLRAYLHTIQSEKLMPQSPREIATQLRVFMLEKALYELGYEMVNRPDWLSIPARAILEYFEETS